MRSAVVLLALAMLLAGCAESDDGPVQPQPTTPPADEGDDAAPEPEPEPSPGPAPEPEPAPAPEVTSWDLGAAAGCAPDAQPGACVSFQQGPGEQPVDGHWIELGESYWGWSMGGTIDNARGDSDCWWVNEGLEIIGNGNRVENPCGGTIPQRTAWVFIYSYAEPAFSFHVNVSPP